MTNIRIATVNDYEIVYSTNRKAFLVMLDRVEMVAAETQDKAEAKIAYLKLQAKTDLKAGFPLRVITLMDNISHGKVTSATEDVLEVWFTDDNPKAYHPRYKITLAYTPVYLETPENLNVVEAIRERVVLRRNLDKQIHELKGQFTSPIAEVIKAMRQKAEET